MSEHDEYDPRNYQSHITTMYDAEFKKIDELKLDPCVGKSYDRTRIFIVGKSTYARESTEWGPEWSKYVSKERDPSRILVFGGSDEHKPFKTMSTMFFQGADKEKNGNAVNKFWESVAFNNFCQKVVPERNSPCEDIEQAKTALLKTIEIIKPKLCLVWGTKFEEFGLQADWEAETNIGGKRPRGINQTPPIIGIGHPSQGFNIKKTLGFLRDHPASKKPIEDALNYLKTAI